MTLSSRALTVLAALALGCGAADQTREVRRDGESRRIGVTAGENACPMFGGAIVSPFLVPASQSAVVALRAVDPDGDDRDLAYAWQATSGSFSTDVGRVTEYRCDTAGVQVLTAIVTDSSGCESLFDLDVNCLGE